MHRSEKPAVIDGLIVTLSKSSIAVATHPNGLTVAESTVLRAKVREAGASYKVVKNTLAKIAVKDSEWSDLSDLFKGVTGLAAGDDPVSTAKAIIEFAKENDKLTVAGGVMDGKVLSANDVKALSSLPPLDSLRGKIIGLIQAPAQQLASISQAPAGQLARVFGAYGKTES